MKLTRALWGTMFLLINLPPMAHPEVNSNSAATPPNSPATPIGSLNRNLAQTDGAAGLFTPNSLGNAAALHAQMNGGLTASPIVDGNGASANLTVPAATPPADTGNEAASARSETMNSVDKAGANAMSAPRYSNSMAPSPVAKQSAPNGQATLTARKFMTVKPTATRISTVLNERISIASPPADALQSIGQLTGSITYADGKKVLLGTAGNAFIDPDKGTLTLPNGAKLSMKSAGKSVRREALKNQVRL